jgi:hypothetical protein
MFLFCVNVCPYSKQYHVNVNRNLETCTESPNCYDLYAYNSISFALATPSQLEIPSHKTNLIAGL